MLRFDLARQSQGAVTTDPPVLYLFRKKEEAENHVVCIGKMVLIFGLSSFKQWKEIRKNGCLKITVGFSMEKKQAQIINTYAWQ